MLSYNHNYQTRFPSCQYIFTACDSAGTGDDTSRPRGTGKLEYQGETTSLTQLVLEPYGYSESAYNTDISIFPDGLNVDNWSGFSGRFIYLETFSSTSEVTAGTYNRAATDAANTFSDFSDISTVVNGEYTSTDPIIAGSFTISVDGSTYSISGTVTTSKGDAIFSYTGPVNLVVPQ